MSTVFIGGSRHVSRLPLDVRKRLDNVVSSGHNVIVGDANGADKAVQKYFFDARYDNVTVFCSGVTPRNNLGSWRTHPVDAPKAARGFHFYAAKDREMARHADFGFMIWDGKSPGTALNVLRLVRAGKKSVLFNVPEKLTLNITSINQWSTFLAQCSSELRTDLERRATPEEWAGPVAATDPGLPLPLDQDSSRESAQLTPMSQMEMTSILNKALASGDATAVMSVLRGMVHDLGKPQVANSAGLAIDSLDRSLEGISNLDFAMTLKVIASIGLRLEAKAERDVDARPINTGSPPLSISGHRNAKVEH